MSCCFRRRTPYMKSQDQDNNDRTTAALAKTYEPHSLEQRIYQGWERARYFSPRSESSPGQASGGMHGAEHSYCIMIPPPNVTGSLHMGHAFQDTLMDALIRYHRMLGDNTLWQAGTDHAGIATQMVVERQLEAEGKSRHDLGRQTFVQRIWEWKAQSGGTITRQLRRMGASLDWSRERFTMDEGLSRAVTEVFVRLHEEGLIYRGKRLVNWDPVLHTAVSDLEVVAEEEAGHLWHIRYPVEGTAEHVVVATTRPETMLGDTAVAVNPDDGRYTHLVGRSLQLPLTDRRIPVIADNYVDKEFGSGCVKITPAHDFNDYEVGKRHGLPIINIFYPDACINLPGSPYHGLDRFEARRKIVAELEAAGLIEKIENHKLKVPRGDRTNAVIEPFLTDQWYVKVAPLAAEAIKAVEDGRVKFVPDTWTKTYFEWMRNIQDWCISRQIWWGHRIPAWYDAEGNCYVARTAAAAHALAAQKRGEDVLLEQDEDVLDTWFSSALWPFSTLGWPDATPALREFYPTSVLVTGFDIIFFWVARMIMMGLKFTGEVPFREVYIHGLVRDAHGEKMSKSKGNVLDPIDLIDGIDIEALVAKRTTGLMRPQDAPKIEKSTRKDFSDGIPAFGTDALRMTFASLATQGRDIKFDLGRIEGYRNFCNKLWNAARYVLMNTEGHDCGQTGGDADLNAADRWITSRLHEITSEVAAAFKDYRFDLATQALYSFVWYEYCDWYLELSKVVLNNPQAAAQQLRGTRRTLVRTLEAALRLLHPIIPFISEEIWLRTAQLAAAKGETIMLQPYPQTDVGQIDPAAVKEMRWVMAVITAARTVRSERDIAPSKLLPVLLQNGSETEHAWMQQNEHYLKPLARMESVTWLSASQTAPESAMQLVGQLKVLVPLGAFINKQEELARLDKEIDKTEKEIDKARGKLANSNFVARAPKQVVEQEQKRVQEFETALAILKTQKAKVTAMTG